MTAYAARFADANPVTTLAGTGSLLFVYRDEDPMSCKDCTRSSNGKSGSEHVHYVCHADDGASTTRSGRCQRQLEALGSGRVPPPIIIDRSERNRHEAQQKGGTALSEPGWLPTSTSVGILVVQRRGRLRLMGGVCIGKSTRQKSALVKSRSGEDCAEYAIGEFGKR